MAHGSGQCIGGIEVMAIQFELEDIGEHGSDLFFGSIAVSGDGLFDLFRRVFGDPDSFGDRCGDGHPLCPAQFEHGLWILAVKRRFDGHFPGLVDLNDTLQALEDMLEFILMVFHLFQVDHPHVEELQLLLLHLYDGIAQNIGAGVYP